MFEKEAEEYRKDLKSKFFLSEPQLDFACQGFKDGAQFGYNKANEWHYPAKGKYPKECENVLCYCKVVNVKFYCVGHIVVGGDNKIRWWSSDRSEKLNVYAWKEITPTKEIKQND